MGGISTKISYAGSFTIHDNGRLLSPLPLYIDTLYCKGYAPRSDCSLRSSLIRVHIVCVRSKVSLVCIRIYAADVMQTTFPGQKYKQDKG